MANSLDTREFITGYLAEADEHVRNVSAHLLQADEALKRGETPHKLVRELFRALHTLKGLSAMVGVDPIVDLSHEMEAILRAADQKTAALSSPAIELLLRAMAAVEQRLKDFARNAPVQPAPPALVTALRDLQLGPIVRGAGALSELDLPADVLAKLTSTEVDQLRDGIRAGRRGVSLLFAPSPERAARGLSITSVREKVLQVAEVVKVLPRSVPKTPDAPTGLAFVLLLLTDQLDAAVLGSVGAKPEDLTAIALSEPPPERESVDLSLAGGMDDAIGQDTIRVDVTRLDDALEKLSGLIVTRFRLAAQVSVLRERGVDVRELSAILHEHGLQIRHLRGAITRARMVPVAQVLERVPLLVRGLSRSTGKRIDLRLDVGEAELDKAVAEKLFPAVVHLIRNAVDHAIERPEARVAAGKPEAGQVHVHCASLSDAQLELTITDDGAGVDRARVAQKARSPVPQDDRQLLALITRPGLSTQDVATQHSGRGMGMDIVKRIVVEQLRGELSLSTEPSRGTTFRLRIPLSISILDSFAFRCGGQRFVAPLAMVEEIVELEAGNVFRAPAPGASERVTRMLLRRGEPIPLFDLGGLFALARESEHGSALVVQAQGERFALAVDRMLGQQEVVVRPLEDPLVKRQGVAGTTDLGDGVPTLVLDLLGIGQLAATRRAS